MTLVAFSAVSSALSLRGTKYNLFAAASQHALLTKPHTHDSVVSLFASFIMMSMSDLSSTKREDAAEQESEGRQADEANQFTSAKSAWANKYRGVSHTYTVFLI